MLVDDEALPTIEARFHRPGLIFEGMRLDKCQEYFRSVNPVAQRWLDLLRWTGGSKRINTIALDGNYHLVTAGYTGYSRLALPFLRMAIWFLRRSHSLRRFVTKSQKHLLPKFTKTFSKNINPAWSYPAPRAGVGPLYPARSCPAWHLYLCCDCWMG